MTEEGPSVGIVPRPLMQSFPSSSFLGCRLRMSGLLVCLFLVGPVHGRDLGEISFAKDRIQAVYPESDRFETHARVLEGSRLRAIQALLPKGMQYHERGKRVVYSAYRGSSPLGFLHVRNENGHWGVVQVAWHLNLDLTIRDFTFLRCREPQRVLLESDQFRELLSTHGLEELCLLLDEQGRIRSEVTDLSSDALPLAETLVISAIKSLAATQIGWSLDLSKSVIRDLANRRFSEVADVEFDHSPFSSSALIALEKARLDAFDTRTRNSLLLARVLGPKQELIASLLHIRLEIAGQIEPLVFTFVEGKVVAADSLAETQRPQILSRVSRLPQMTFDELCNSACKVAQGAAIGLCIADPPDGEGR